MGNPKNTWQFAGYSMFQICHHLSSVPYWDIFPCQNCEQWEKQNLWAMISCQPWSSRGSGLSQPGEERENLSALLQIENERLRQNIWEAISHVTSRRIASRRLRVRGSPGSWRPAGLFQTHRWWWTCETASARWQSRINDSSSLNGDLWLSLSRVEKVQLLPAKFSHFQQHPGFIQPRRGGGETIPSVIPFSSSQTAYCSLNINWQAWASLHFDYCFSFLFLYNYLRLTGWDCLQNVNKSFSFDAN